MLNQNHSKVFNTWLEEYATCILTLIVSLKNSVRPTTTITLVLEVFVNFVEIFEVLPFVIKGRIEGRDRTQHQFGKKKIKT